jgi:hypothetical protein
MQRGEGRFAARLEGLLGRLRLNQKREGNCLPTKVCFVIFYAPIAAVTLGVVLVVGGADVSFLVVRCGQVVFVAVLAAVIVASGSVVVTVLVAAVIVALVLVVIGFVIVVSIAAGVVVIVVGIVIVVAFVGAAAVGVVVRIAEC